MPIYRNELDQARCSCSGSDHACGERVRFESTCPHGPNAQEVGCIHATHTLALACYACSRVQAQFALEPRGRHICSDQPASQVPTDETCVWGYEDWDRRSEGHPSTWIRFCHPETEVVYEKSTGELSVRCPVCQAINLRFAIAMLPVE